MKVKVLSAPCKPAVARFVSLNLLALRRVYCVPVLSCVWFALIRNTVRSQPDGRFESPSLANSENPGSVVFAGPYWVNRRLGWSVPVPVVSADAPGPFAEASGMEPRPGDSTDASPCGQAVSTFHREELSLIYRAARAVGQALNMSFRHLLGSFCGLIPHYGSALQAALCELLHLSPKSESLFLLQLEAWFISTWQAWLIRYSVLFARSLQ